MKVSLAKLELLLARQCKPAAALRPGISPTTMLSIKEGKDIRTDVVGRIAKALEVDPTEIIETEER